MLSQRSCISLICLLIIFVFLFASTPTTAQAAGVVGNGTPASCTEAALKNAINGGGSVTFNCGGAATITITQEILIQQGNTTIDGGGNITLTASPGVRVLQLRTWGTLGSSSLTLRNLSITGTTRTGSQEDANGAAVYVRSQSANFNQDIPTLNVENVTFSNNISNQTNNGNNPYDYGGGAIYILGGILNVTDSTFTGNRANRGAGGAIHVLGSNLRIENSTFTGNIATATSPSSTNSGYGGAIYVDGSLFRGNGNVTILDSDFRNNSAASQGGFAYINLYPSRNSYLYINGSQFVGNRVSGGGLGHGGALSGGGTGGSSNVFIANSFFQNNSVTRSTQQGGSGGAIGLAQPTNTTIVNSTFVGNRAEGVCSNCFNANGGAISIGGTGTIINSTIVDNYAGWVGGGIAGSDITLRNTILADNTAENGGNGWQIMQHCSNEFTNGGNNIQFPDRNPNPNFWNEVVCAANITIADPQLKPLQTAANGMGYLEPRNNSPAVNAGNNQVFNPLPVSMPDDQVGNTRIQAGTVDIGAIETAPVDPNTLPRITSTFPSPNAVGFNLTDNLTVSFSESISPAGSVTFSCNDQPYTFAVSGGEDNTYTLNPNNDLPAESTCALVVPVTSIVDSDSNYLVDNDGTDDGTYRLTFETIGVPPQITNISPMNGAIDVPVNTTIDATFTEVIRAVGSVDFTCLLGNETFTLTVQPNDTQYVATPNHTLPPSSTCTLIIPTDNIEDLRGNKLVDNDGTADDAYTLTFMTEPALQIEATTPTNGATDVPVDANLTVTFNEPIQVAGTGITFVCPTGGTVYPLAITNNGNTYTANPTSDLPFDTECTLTIPTASLTDQTGNLLVDDDGVDDGDGQYTLTFTTEQAPAQAAQLVEQADEPNLPVVIESAVSE